MKRIDFMAIAMGAAISVVISLIITLILVFLIKVWGVNIDLLVIKISLSVVVLSVIIAITAKFIDDIQY